MLLRQVKTINLPFISAWLLPLALIAAATLPAGCSGRSKADKLHAEGMILAKNHQAFKAAEKFEAALKLQPNRVDTLVECAQLYLNMDKFDTAGKYAARAVSLDGKNLTARMIQGQAHLALARRPAPEGESAPPVYDKTELGKAVEVVTELRRLNPEAIEGVMLQARIDQANSQAESAEKLWRKALAISPANATAMLGLAETAMMRKDFAEAEKMARQAVAAEKTPSSTALDTLALALAFQEKFEEAYQTLAPLVSEKNKQPEVTHFLLAGRILLTQIDRLNGPGATSATQAGARPQAEELKRAVGRLGGLGRLMKGYYPAMADSFFYRAISFQLENNMPEAIRDFEAACSKAPRERRYQLALGMAQMQAKNFGAARQALRNMLRDHPGDRQGQLLLGQCYALEGSYEEATDALRNLVIEEPGNKAAKETLGKVLVLTPDPEKVREGMALLAEVTGGDVNAPGNRELMLAQAAVTEGEKLGRAGSRAESDAKFAEAERLLGEAARLQPGNYLPELKLSEMAARRGDLFSGLLHVRKAARIEPQFAALEARFLARLGQTEAAREKYGEMVKANPTAMGFKLAMADLDVQLGRREEALAAFEGMIRENASDPRPQLHRAMLIGRAEDVEAAVQFLKQYLKNDPNNLTLSLGLGELLGKQGRSSEAIDVLAEMTGRVQARLAAIGQRADLKASVAEANALLASLKLKLAIHQLLAGQTTRAGINADEAREKDPAQAGNAALLKAVAELAEQRPERAAQALAAPGEEARPAPWPFVAALAQIKGGTQKALDAMGDGDTARTGAGILFTKMLQGTAQEKLAGAAGDLALLAVLTQYPEQAGGALKLADKLLGSLPGEPFVLSLKGDILKATGDLEQAAAAYAALRQAAPEFAPGLLAQADLHVQRADRAAALGQAGEARKANQAAAEACRAYLAKAPRDAQALEKLGMIMQLGGDAAEATKLYRQAIEIDPGRWTAYNNLAWNLAEAKKFDEAAQYGEKALAAASTDGGVQDTMGWIELKRKNVDRALDLLGQASLRLPNNPEVRYHLAQALAEKGQRERALVELESIALATPQYARIEAVREMIRQLNPQSEILKNSNDGSSPKPQGAGSQ